jgi:Family of unknown function (DUF5996)
MNYSSTPLAFDVPPAAWPSLPVAEWQPTRDTLQLWTQVVGKVALANAPPVNHWWHATLSVTARGLSTSLLPYRDGRSFEIEFDFSSHLVRISVTDGTERVIALEPRSVSAFYQEVMRKLDELGLTTHIWPVPVEIEGAIPFTEDHEHAAYDAEHARRFWQVLVQLDRVFSNFRGRFIGKASPVHFFWGGFDLAATRFSGRSAPRFPRRVPNCGPQVMEEAYSHEVSSAGYWPAPDGEGVLYSYAYPEPDGFREWPVGPAGASYSEELGEFVLPYEIVRTATHPDTALLEFLQSTYEAAAECAQWDRARLERAT